MSSQYDDMMGSEQPQETHPDNSMNYKMAGDVIPIRPQGAIENLAGLVAQVVNSNSMKNIAKGGPSAVDTTNIKMYPRK